MLMEHGEPVVAIEVGAGQFEYVDEDGVATGPIVSIGLGTRDGELHRYTFHPAETLAIAPVIASASRAALDDYDKKQAARRRKEKRFAIAFMVFIVVTLAGLQGYTVATVSYSAGHGDWFEGMMAALNEVFELIGIFAVGGFAAAAIKRNRYKKVTLK